MKNNQKIPLLHKKIKLPNLFRGWFIIAILFTLVLVVIFRSAAQTETSVWKDEALLSAEQFYNEELFVKGELDKETNWLKDDVYGAIVAHHSLAAKYLSSFFTTLEGKQIKKIILIGPNHKPHESELMYTTASNWSTKYGTVQGDEESVNYLKSNTMVVVDDNFVSNEHSVATIIPYVAKYAPGCQIIPIIVNEVSLDSIDSMATFVSGIVKPGVIVIAAVDFSHYLTANEAQVKDNETLEAINNNDYLRMLEFGSDHTDAATTLVLLDKIMEKVGAPNFSLLKNTNSFELTGKQSRVTSYVFGVYRGN